MEKILDGRKLAEKLNSELKDEISKIIEKTNIRPKLATILIGSDSASQVYVNIKHKTCAQVGIESVLIKLDENISTEELKREIDNLNNDTSVNGILLQLPLPQHLKAATSELIEKISPLKDVDGFHPCNRGKLFDYDETLAACTPKGIIALLENYNVEIKGKDITIVNRSNLVGKPLIFMFLKRNATPTVCHTSTKDLDRYIKQSDILVVGVSRPNFITKEKIKEGVVIIDVGTNRVNGKLCGDVNYEDVFDKCGAITPSPGGVGPCTVAFLMQNTFAVYKKQSDRN